MDLVHQLGQLFLAAVPTVVIVFLFYFFLRWSFFNPISRVLAERRARIEGSRRAAEASRHQAQEDVYKRQPRAQRRSRSERQGDTIT